MEEMKSCKWDDIKGVAEKIFNILTDGGDLEWAERAWHTIEKTLLCAYSDEQEYYRVLIRLFCLGEMYHIYNDLARNEPYEPGEKYSEWVDKSKLQKIRFIVLAGEDFYEDIYFEYDYFSGVIHYLIEQEYQLVIRWLTSGFGDKDNLILSLERSCGRSIEDEEMTYEEVLAAGYHPADARISYETLRLFQWKEAGFSRSYEGFA
jgi:hypothetical protein